MFSQSRRRTRVARNIRNTRKIHISKPTVKPIVTPISKPMPGAGWANTTNPDGTVTLGHNAAVRNNDGSRTYALPTGVDITNLKRYSIPQRTPPRPRQQTVWQQPVTKQKSSRVTLRKDGREYVISEEGVPRFKTSNRKAAEEKVSKLRLRNSKRKSSYMR